MPNKVNKNILIYEPAELKTLIDALNGAPTYLSKRFILKNLCGWTDDMIADNIKLFGEEQQQIKNGDRAWR